MKTPKTAALAVILLLVLAGAPARGAPAPSPGDGEGEPFPVSRTTILREEKKVYTVEGRVRIPKGVEVTCLKDVHIKAKGSGPAVIEVEGSLVVHGVSAREVIFEGVTIEPQETFLEIRMDKVIMRNGGGVRTKAESGVSGKLFLELMQMMSGAPLDVVFRGGSIDLSSMDFSEMVKVRCVDPPGSRGNRVVVNIRGCTSTMLPDPGFAGGLEVENPYELNIRISRLAGPRTSLRNWDSRLLFDSNKVKSPVLEFVQEEAGRFSRATVQKCDIYSDSILATAPANARVKDVLEMERCWFKGVTDPKALLGKVIRDGTGDPENGTRVVLTKPGSRPLELAGSEDR